MVHNDQGVPVGLRYFQDGVHLRADLMILSFLKPLPTIHICRIPTKK
jgi:hypothetical protein